MSRIGKMPIKVPSGVQVNISASAVSLQGPQGKLDYPLRTGISAKKEGDSLVLNRVGNDAQSRANHGTARAVLNQMMEGVSKGWKRSLDFTGVGYNAAVQGTILKLNMGYSHEVKLELPKGIKCKVEKTNITLEGADKQVLGDIAARIRKVRPPEPYLGKGIKYTEERIRRKAGKAGKK